MNPFSLRRSGAHRGPARAAIPTPAGAMRSGRRWRLAAVLSAAALTATACGGAVGTGYATDAGPAKLAANDWGQVLRQAREQTVNWYMYGGDSTLNTFVNGYLADRLEKFGVKVNEVKVTDTSDAINTMLGEKQAGKATGGSVDAVWVNGENFATGMQAKLWACGWPRRLPNAKYVDFTNLAVSHDFGTPVRGCEAVWQQADSALVYDSAKLGRADVASLSALFDWAKKHPGQFTYPAPPDFTGSMVVRTILYGTVADPAKLAGPFNASTYRSVTPRLWQRLNAIAPSLWRGGSTYPQSQDQVQQLYSNGEIAAFFTYGPGAVADQVRKGLYPTTTREAVPSVGNIANFSFLGIPANAAHRAGALVLANVLEDPATQLALYKAEGIYPGIDLAKTSAGVRQRFAAVPTSPSVLPLPALTRHALPELDPRYVTALEKDWRTQVAAR